MTVGSGNCAGCPDHRGGLSETPAAGSGVPRVGGRTEAYRYAD
jgi:hypothetical protein